MHRRMPVVTAAECGRELAWRGDIGIAVENMTDFVRILFLNTRQRQLREALRGMNVKSTKGEILRGELWSSVRLRRDTDQ